MAPVSGSTYVLFVILFNPMQKDPGSSREAGEVSWGARASAE